MSEGASWLSAASPATVGSAAVGVDARFAMLIAAFMFACSAAYANRQTLTAYMMKLGEHGLPAEKIAEAIAAALTSASPRCAIRSRPIRCAI